MKIPQNSCLIVLLLFILGVSAQIFCAQKTSWYKNAAYADESIELTNEC